MKNQNLNLKIGDKIGFTFLASSVDSSDKTLFFPVISITERDGETAYVCEFPDGGTSSPIVQSSLAYRAVQIEPLGISEGMLCISERRDEFVASLERGKKSNLEVFGHWDRDTFVVVNHDNKKEYRVNLETANNLLHGFCDCPDFHFKKRICKHLSAVLIDSMFIAKN